MSTPVLFYGSPSPPPGPNSPFHNNFARASACEMQKLDALYDWDVSLVFQEDHGYFQLFCVTEQVRARQSCFTCNLTAWNDLPEHQGHWKDVHLLEGFRASQVHSSKELLRGHVSIRSHLYLLRSDAESGFVPSHLRHNDIIRTLSRYVCGVNILT